MSRKLRFGALLGALLVFAGALLTPTAQAVSITVDGSNADWPVDPATTRIVDDGGDAGILDDRDLDEVHATNTSSTLYLRFDTVAATNWTQSTPLRLYFYTNSSTGSDGTIYTPVGVDYILTITFNLSGDPFTFNLVDCTVDFTVCSVNSSPTGFSFASGSGQFNELAIQRSVLGISGNTTFGLGVTLGTGSVDGSSAGSFGSVTLPTPTPVTLASFTADRTAAGVLVAWSTASEINIVGYHLLRSTTGSRNDAQRITSELIAATGTGVIGGSYTFLDSSDSTGTSAGYWIEAVNLDGNRDEYGPVVVRTVLAGRSTVYFPFIVR